MTSAVTSTNALTPALTSASTSSAAAASTTASTSAASSAASSFSEGDFLQLLIAQMTNQDPLQPTDSTAMVTQLATFSQVEQSVQQSTQLSAMSSQLQALDNTNAAGLVGRTVTLQNTSMQWGGTLATNASVNLSSAAQNVTAAVVDSSGNTVRTMSLGAQPAGPLTITWNGQENSGQNAPTGTYTVNVTATGANGQPINVSQTVTGQVSQVSFNQGSPSVTLTNGAVAPVSQLVTVSGTATSAAGSGGGTSSTTSTNP